MTREARAATEALLDHFGVSPRGANQDLLWALGEAFAHLPYENLTKLIRREEVPAEGFLAAGVGGLGQPRVRGAGGRAGAAWRSARRRTPEEVVRDHLRWGTGGTCFALTHTFVTVLRQLGFRARPVLCDMRAGPNTHSAVWIDLPDGAYLMDPGYLLYQPVRLRPGGVAVRRTGVAEVRVSGAPDGATFDLHTGSQWRYRLRAAPVPRAQFEALWDDSFGWGHMRNVHVSRALPEVGGYAYVHGHKLRVQGAEGRQNENLRGREPEVLAARFGIHPEVVARAYAIVRALRHSARAAEGPGPGALGDAGRGRAQDPAGGAAAAEAREHAGAAGRAQGGAR